MSKNDFDFITEYAKSSRAGCTKCKGGIVKDELRIGKMVQAANFDGKIPRWFHIDCFFKGKDCAALKTIEMIHGKDSLRWEDQEKLVNTIKAANGEAAAPVSASVSAPASAAATEEPTAGTKRKAGAGKGKGKGKASKKQKMVEQAAPAPAPELDPTQLALKEQNTLLWEVKDKLKSHLSNGEMRRLLEHNGQISKGGEHTLVNRCAEGMMFGALPPCAECGGQLHVVNGAYKCSSSTDWAKCTWQADTVKMKRWTIPDDLQENDYLAAYKYKARKRVLVKAEIVKAAPTEQQLEPVVKNPLEGMVIALAGTKRKQAELAKMVEELGGSCTSSVSKKTTHLITTAEEVKAGKSKVKQAEKAGLPMLSEDFLEETYKEKRLLDKARFLVGGTLPQRDDARPEPRKVEEERKVKVVVKGRAAIDNLVGEQIQKDYHVLEEGDTVWDSVLNMTDLVMGNNTYYALQLLQHDLHPNKFILFRKWGRIGTDIGSSKTENFGSREAAQHAFKKLYKDKTDNQWEDRHNFVKRPNKFFPIDVVYGHEDEDDLAKVKAASNSLVKSRLDARVQSLVSLIFDIKLMEQSLLEMEIDLKKMPLGKLSKRHIESGYEVLKKIEKELQEHGEDPAGAAKTRLIALCNEFYTRIPHDFGHDNPPVITTMAMLKEKIDMMEAFINIEIATSLMRDSKGDPAAAAAAKSVLDANYEKLNCGLVALDRDNEEFRMAEMYCLNQKQSYRLRVQDVFKVARNGEYERYTPKIGLGNRQLLWHGSRTTNYVGILSQGLRIAPPEAPCSGYRFGKGIYMADVCEKSASYCRASGSDTILMMLCEAALGTPKKLKQDKYMEKPLAGTHSTKALGAIAPDPKETIKIEGDIEVPLGKPVQTGIKSSCTHNEYIVYDVSQVTIRYLLRIQIS